MSSVKNFSSLPAMIKVEENIGYQNGKSKEHRVGSWSCTMITKVFNSDEWIITPEKIDDYSNKKPDFTIEKFKDNNLHLHAVVELKRLGGDRFEKILQQLSKAITERTVEHEKDLETFVIAQRGWSIGFFEYLPYETLLDEQKIENFRGMISLTQENEQLLFKNPKQFQELKSFWETLPVDLQHLFHEDSGKSKDSDLIMDADSYTIPCIFDIRTHKEQVEFLFRYIATWDVRYTKS